MGPWKASRLGWIGIVLLLAMLSRYADCATTKISTTDSNLVNGLSPLNWVQKTGFICSATGGASMKVGFTGTRLVTLNVDAAVIKTTVAARYPILSWSVNNGPAQTRQLAKGDTALVLASDVPDPVIDLYLKGFSPFENRYTGDAPENSVKITGFTVDAGGQTKAVLLPAKIWMNIGNSIESGDGALYAQGQGRPSDDTWAASNDGRASYGYLLANHYGYREVRLAYGGYNWSGGLAGLPKLTDLMDNTTSTVSRLVAGAFSPRPDVVLINLGENGVPAKTDVTDALTKLRSRTGPSTKIMVMIPVSGKGRAVLTDAFNTYKTSAGDSAAFLIDLGTLTFSTADGQHPTAAGHRTIYNSALPAFDKLVTVQTTRVRAAISSFARQSFASGGFDTKGRRISPRLSPLHRRFMSKRTWIGLGGG